MRHGNFERKNTLTSRAQALRSQWAGGGQGEGAVEVQQGAVWRAWRGWPQAGPGRDRSRGALEAIVRTGAFILHGWGAFADLEQMRNLN